MQRIEDALTFSMIGRFGLFTIALVSFGCKEQSKSAASQQTAAPASSSTPSTSAASPAELENAFAALDINDDNQLDGIEVKNCGCAIADDNGDTEITRAEYLAAGLLGKFRPAAPSATASAPPTPPAQTPPMPPPTETPSAQPSETPPTSPPSETPPAPPPDTAHAAAIGVPPGTYKCAGSVGGTYMTTGRVVIVDGQTYATGTDMSGQGTYKFHPDTKMIVFTSGPNSDINTISYARLVSPRHIQMKTGRRGSYLWDCKR